MKTKAKEGTVGFFHSMSFKVMLLAISAVLITSMYSYFAMIPRMQEMLQNNTQSQMKSLTESYAQILNSAIISGKIEESGYDMYDALLSKAGIKGISSSGMENCAFGKCDPELQNALFRLRCKTIWRRCLL